MGLYGGVSLEDILAGRQITRNPGIVNIFNKLGIIENYGRGIERMFESYAPYNLKPFIDSSNSFFVVNWQMLIMVLIKMKLKMRLNNQLSMR